MPNDHKEMKNYAKGDTWYSCIPLSCLSSLHNCISIRLNTTVKHTNCFGVLWWTVLYKTRWREERFPRVGRSACARHHHCQNSSLLRPAGIELQPHIVAQSSFVVMPEVRLELCEACRPLKISWCFWRSFLHITVRHQKYQLWTQLPSGYEIQR